MKTMKDSLYLIKTSVCLGVGGWGGAARYAVRLGIPQGRSKRCHYHFSHVI